VPGQGIIDDLQARGLLHDSTDLATLRDRLDREPITLYAGFDPTADSLHIGHLVPLLLLRRFQDAGHRPIALAGGATGMIGDPTGRSEERNLLDDQTLDQNVRGISDQLSRFLDFDRQGNPAKLVDNRTWTQPVSAIEFLRDVGKFVTVNQMLSKESIKARLASETGISYTEFSYMLLQANDFRWLFEHEGCELQVGGSDQWGNITAGIDLVRKALAGAAYGLTVPLVMRADGTKFGKTAAGAVWLDPARTSPYAFYQYWMQTDDRDLERFLLQMSMLPVAEVAEVIRMHGNAPERREGQRRLAVEVTSLVHGEPAASDAARASTGFTQAVADLTETEWAGLATELPATRLARHDFEGLDLIELLTVIGLASSKGDARRTIDGGGVNLNDVRQPASRPLSGADLLAGGYLLVRKGKKQRHIVIVE